jgi:hypothetical protein
MSGDRTEDVEDEEGGEGDQLDNADVSDPTNARRTAEDEMMETPAAP